METEFTPVTALAGGALIGIAAVIMLAANGRVAGISGIVSRLFPPSVDRAGWLQGLFFIGGLVAAVLVYRFVTGDLPAQVVPDKLPLMLIAGLLVGFGSVLGNGCTSGHGVCGISRLSLRSVAATAVFMGTAFVTVFLVRHGLGG